MTAILLLLSCTAFAAIAGSRGQERPWWWKWFGRSTPKPLRPTNYTPVLNRESGWTFIHCDDPESFEKWLDEDEHSFPFRPEEEPALGSHLLIEMFGCNAHSLEEERSVGTAMRDAAVHSNATVVAESFHEFKPYGVSGAVIIQESHYTIHTWPEHQYAAVDLFYCGGTILVHEAIEVLRARFKPTRIKFLVVRRGIQSEVNR